MSDLEDIRSQSRDYADKHGFIAFSNKDHYGKRTFNDWIITVASNKNQSSTIGMTDKQARSLLEQMKRELEQGHE